MSLSLTRGQGDGLSRGEPDECIASSLVRTAGAAAREARSRSEGFRLEQISTRFAAGLDLPAILQGRPVVPTPSVGETPEARGGTQTSP